MISCGLFKNFQIDAETDVLGPLRDTYVMELTLFTTLTAFWTVDKKSTFFLIRKEEQSTSYKAFRDFFSDETWRYVRITNEGKCEKRNFPKMIRG